MTPIDALAWVHVRDRRLLSVRTSDRAKFSLPGGKREPGEGDVTAVCAARSAKSWGWSRTR